METRNWLITGCSTGLGRALAIYVANQGDKVVGTVRKDAQIAELEALHPYIKGVLLDVQSQAQIDAGIDYIKTNYGRLDVLVNNAGYGEIGTIEDTAEEQVVRQMDINVYGPLRLMRGILPMMRAQRSGHIMNITSIAGLRGSQGLGIYNGSKFALEGIGEALALEVKHLGIHVTNVEPGPFRTLWAGPSATIQSTWHEDYEASAGAFINMLNERNGQQPGDPDKAAAAMYTLSCMEEPPVHLPLGNFAYDAAYLTLDMMRDELKKHEDIGRPTDFT